MNRDELKTKFERAYKTIQAERRMREHVFRNDPAKQAAKVAEMDDLLAIVTEFKDALKAQLPPDFEQPALLPVPERATYN